MDEYTPKEIVKELDRYIIGQKAAKRSVAVALRNRYRRSRLKPELREEITPKNIILIGPTGVGKTEIARRLAKMVNAPFVKVEATKYTEVGYVGRDVESMVRDLVEASIRMIKKQKMGYVKDKAAIAAEERIVDILIPRKKRKSANPLNMFFGEADEIENEDEVADETLTSTRDKFLQKLREKKLENAPIEIEIDDSQYPGIGIIPGLGGEDVLLQVQDVFDNILPKKKKKKKTTIKEARKIFRQEEAQKLVDMDEVIDEAIDAVEQKGIIFLDEIDKIAGKEMSSGPDVSREGVQRDILPIIEGTTIMTKYGPVKTDHILFIAAGAFHVSKVSDLIPELQGRFPIQVELDSLSQDDFKQILIKPENAIIKQQIALMGVENIELQFTDGGIDEIARVAFIMNQTKENIGARRLYTVIEKLMDDISFNADELSGQKLVIDAEYVDQKLKDIIKGNDLGKYIL